MFLNYFFKVGKMNSELEIIKACLNTKSRKNIPKLIDKLNFKIAAEIGVFKGDFSATLLTSNIHKLYSIDAWDVCYSSRERWQQNNLNAVYKIANKKLLAFKNRSEIIRTSSDIAATLFPNCFFDFVYIDASHDYQSIKNDIMLWWPKIKANGILSGHDYCERDKEKHLWGVIQAVNEHVAAYNQDLFILNEDKFPSWIVVKMNRTPML